MNINPHPNSLSAETKIFTALLFYATGSYQRLIGQSYNISISQSSVSNCVKEVSQLIYTHLRNEYIKFPTTAVEKQIVKQQFMENTQFPGVIGAIDCTHIRILAPSVEEHNYVNRKGFHSKNVQIIVYLDLVNTRRHCSARNCVECCIGVFKARFRCILGERGLRYSPYYVGVIVVACTVLHNLCIQYRLPENNLDIPNIENIRNEHVIAQNFDNLVEGRRIRDNVIRRYFN
ncbi:PREDICTED: uncharacterized protein LOC108768477 [Trachymyrmex cornetzi]|uniref:uncharacterized protein LOC108768477 n=1 Tax=Trachymyrmex cornetzi TaxID=471704 RepID=UPI00084EF366|nr:PREDICTED: uncharacterized protein LOC108768477 [Trachymyrmex cornetzi]